MRRTKHAQDISDRFKEMVEAEGDSLSEEHLKELTLLIEAGIDTALVESLESIANKVEGLAHEIRTEAERFSQ